MQKEDVDYINTKIEELCSNVKYKLNPKHFYLTYVNRDIAQQVSVEVFLNYISNVLIPDQAQNINNTILKLSNIDDLYYKMFAFNSVRIDATTATKIEKDLLYYIYTFLHDDSKLKQHIKSCACGVLHD